MPEYNRDAGPQTQGRIGFDERETLMAFLLRNPAVFIEARQVLTPEHFTEPYEAIWALCWRCCLDQYEIYGRQVHRVELESDALSRIEDNPGEIPQGGVDELRSFIDYMYEIDEKFLTESQYEAYGFDLLQKFLKERHFADPVRKFMTELGDATPVDVSSLLNDFQNRFSQVQSVTAQVTENLIPDDWEEPALIKVSTGFPFLDAPMGGGAADGEVYGLLGTYGSGKTMLACGIGAEGAKRFFTEAVAAGTMPRQVCHFTYETPPNDIRRRVISYMAHINLTHLENTPYVRTLSRADNRHRYEQELFPSDPRGEFERFEDTKYLRDSYKIMDMRGTAKNRKAGSGWVDEIHAELEKNRRRHGFQPGIVIIDYALICTKRYLKAKGQDLDRQLRHKIGDFGDECRRMIAENFNCQVWVLNQLSGQSNKRAPGATLNHADSAEASNFAENLWYAFCLGNKDRTHGTVLLGCTKTRRSEGTVQSVLQLKGHLSRFVQADDRFMLDPNTHRIVQRSYGEMAAPEHIARTSQAHRGSVGDARGAFVE